MSVELNLNTPSVTTATATAASNTASDTAATAASDEAAKTSAGTGFSEEAAVYEKSDETVNSDGGVYKKTSTDRSAIVAQLKADQEARQNQLMDMVQKMMTGQGKAIGQADDMWKFLAGGNFTVDAATKAQAQADIADDGYWGVEKTSDRIVEFAKALAGDDPAKADKLLSAFEKGFKQATSAWGKDLPDISQRTYDAVHKKFDDWKNSANNTSTANTTDTAEKTAATAAASSVQE